MFDGSGPCRFNRWGTPHECSSRRCPTNVGSSSYHCNSFIVFQHCSRNRSGRNNHRRGKSFDRRARCDYTACSFWYCWRISSEWLRTWCRWTDSWTLVNWKNLRARWYKISPSIRDLWCHRMSN